MSYGRGFSATKHNVTAESHESKNDDLKRNDRSNEDFKEEIKNVKVTVTSNSSLNNEEIKNDGEIIKNRGKIAQC